MLLSEELLKLYSLQRYLQLGLHSTFPSLHGFIFFNSWRIFFSNPYTSGGFWYWNTYKSSQLITNHKACKVNNTKMLSNFQFSQQIYAMHFFKWTDTWISSWWFTTSRMLHCVKWQMLSIFWMNIMPSLLASNSHRKEWHLHTAIHLTELHCIT